MNGFDLPTREGWCIEGYNDKKCISKYYLKSEIETKEKAIFEEKDFDKIDVLECCL